MGVRKSQRAVYLVTAAIVVSMVAGFAMAELSLGGTSTSAQGSQTTTVTPLNGLTWDFTVLSQVNVSTVLSACGSALNACNVYSSSAMVCAGTYIVTTTPCAEGDFIEQVNLTTTALEPFFGSAFPVTVSLTVAVTGTPNGGGLGTYEGPTIWFTESGTGGNSAEHIALLFDIGSITTGPGTVTSVSVLAAAP